jgi:hypothetical protein
VALGGFTGTPQSQVNWLLLVIDIYMAIAPPMELGRVNDLYSLGKLHTNKLPLNRKMPLSWS